MRSGEHIQLIQLRLFLRKGKRSKMSAKGLSGKISFIPNIITIQSFPLSLSTCDVIELFFILYIKQTEISQA